MFHKAHGTYCAKNAYRGCGWMQEEQLLAIAIIPAWVNVCPWRLEESESIFDFGRTETGFLKMYSQGLREKHMDLKQIENVKLSLTEKVVVGAGLEGKIKYRFRPVKFV